MTKSEVEYSEKWCRSKIAELEAEVAEAHACIANLMKTGDARITELEAELREFVWAEDDPPEWKSQQQRIAELEAGIQVRIEAGHNSMCLHNDGPCFCGHDALAALVKTNE